MPGPSGPRMIALTFLTALLAVNPFLTASESDPKGRDYSHPFNGETPINSDLPQPPEPRIYDHGDPAEERDEEKLKRVPSNDPRANNAIATTKALAGVHPAVRAPRPVRGSSRHAGISSPHVARSLQDWEVEDFVLLATVDGAIHARDRGTGWPIWELRAENPMVESTYYSQNLSHSEHQMAEYDFLWIVEPSRDGEIYVYNHKGNGLQKLHLTVKQLAEDMSPYESVDPAVVYTAEKKTKLYTIDAANGSILKVFGTGATLGKSQQSCSETDELPGFDDEQCRPNPSFVLGRTEYTITIQNRDTTEPICTLMYSEWGPNTRDEDLNSQYTTTMDQKYVLPLHDGRIMGLDYNQVAKKQHAYTRKLSSPVARVFDIARPSGINQHDPQLIVLQQPIRPDSNERHPNEFTDKNRIFVNHTEGGGWFALSESTYPHVTGRAPFARCYDTNWLGSKPSGNVGGVARLRESFVGVHDISEYGPWQGSGLTISAPLSEPDAVADHPAAVDDNSATVFESPSTLSSPGTIGNSRIIGGVTENVTDITIVFGCLIMLAFLGINSRTLGKMARQKLDIRSRLDATDEAIPPLLSDPIIPEAPWSEEPLTPPLDHVDTVPKEVADALPTISDPPSLSKSDALPTISDPPSLSKPDALPTISDPPSFSKSPATPPGSCSGSSDEDHGQSNPRDGVRFAENSSAPEDSELASSPKPAAKKKARRGVRGGVKHKKKKGNSKPGQGEAAKEPLPEPIPIATEPMIDTNIQKFNRTSVIETPVKGGTVIQIGHLQLDTLQVLGRGSHGTMVYKGSFGGREVAVKRMLLEYYDVASHEVKLLQESDGHPNVVRYYDREQAGDFLYIALELCPASLEEVVEKPKNYPTLVGPNGLDMPDVLKQITLGVQYLHSLKIVHRDIKPQNILVSATKMVLSNPSAVQPPRLVISDFGLCKKLEGDQNSFRATTMNAAGTSGWRAPELLVDDDPATVQSGHTGGSTSELAVVDPQTNRRATRAIDIFSLGCVFYYVLTNGNHPFDKHGMYMREANIVKGIYDITELQALGDYQWEATDLIQMMIAHNPHDRPDATTVLHHPFFWSAEDRLDFLCHVSDAFEFEPRDPPSEALLYLEERAVEVFDHNDFLRRLPREFLLTLGKQRKYNGEKLLDLLRALRNKKNHYEDIPEHVKARLGGLPRGYLNFWSHRFPSLLMVCHRVVWELGWEGKDRFRKYYGLM